MDQIDVRVHLWRLFCYHGADEDSSEPYLWVIGFKFDGWTLRQQLTRFTWTPDFFFSSGSHGNLGTVVRTGFKVTVPPAVGTWNTALRPIVLTDEQRNSTEVPGAIGFAAVLLEENNVPGYAAEAATKRSTPSSPRRWQRSLPSSIWSTSTALSPHGLSRVFPVTTILRCLTCLSCLTLEHTPPPFS
jgi:hypothetical protein